MIKKISRWATGKKKVRKFLRNTKDENPFHQEPKNILPGAFYFYLAAKYLKNMKSITAKFRDLIKYPCEITMDISRNEDSAEISFYKDDKKLTEITVEYGTRAVNMKNRMQVLYQTPRNLEKILGSKKGMYLSQNYKFYNTAPNQIMNFEGKIEMEDKKRGMIISTRYENQTKEIIAEGKAFVAPFKEETLKKLEEAA